MLARDFLKQAYLFLKVGRAGRTTTDITQKVKKEEKQANNKIYKGSLGRRTRKANKIKGTAHFYPPCRTLIFVKTKRRADT